MDEASTPPHALSREEARRRIEGWIETTRENPLAGLPLDWPLFVWEVLVDDYPDCRYWAAHQVHCPEPIVRRLAADPVGRVRGRIAQKRNLPVDLFAVLAADDYEPVRCAIACNQKTPLALLEALTRDPAAHVAEVAEVQLRLRRERAAARTSDAAKR